MDFSFSYVRFKKKMFEFFQNTIHMKENGNYGQTID